MMNSIEISPVGNLLIYRNRYSAEFIKNAINEHGLNGLKVNTRSENLVGLEFLEDFGFLKSLEIVGYGDFDFGFLGALTELENLSIGVDGKGPIDLSRQISMTKLTLLWRNKSVHGLEYCARLRSLCLVEFSEDDLAPIQVLTHLKEFRLKTGRIRSLHGLEGFGELATLEIGNCRKLVNVDSLTKVQSLCSLRLEACPNIQNYDPIEFLTDLENLEIIDCSQLPTIRFVERLTRLKRLSLLGNSNVVDGDIKSAQHVPEVFYKHRSHYNVKIMNKNYENVIKTNQNNIKDKYL